MCEEHLVITIDGPAASGKSTIAKALAQRLGIRYLNTGAMFRAIALTLGQDSWLHTSRELKSKLSAVSFSLKGSGENTKLLLHGRPLPSEIANEQVGLWASHLGKLTVVRQHLKKEQRKLGKRFCLVAEGRDMGSVVFPWAKYKFFLDASPEERARRRWHQLQEMGIESDLSSLTREIVQRDQQDRQREQAPLKPAPDSFVIDNSELSKEEVLELLLSLVKQNSCR